MGLEISNTTVRIVDLLPPGGFSLEGMHARNVTFLGPAVLLLHGNVIFGGTTNVGGSVESILWTLEAGRTEVMGAIDAKDATFDDCTFVGVGFASTHELLQQLILNAHV
ncbi:hypothetical protein [Microbacterium trichothecenolyticum]|uniref:Uncharacterized protein n=1 Tax=Microbacterium trichothecenolyticum TaxID=69370 RepID=A0ABU0TR69_MICTR|nr:hypothetical protein [Microbacterium trichothecenolyticum]MDQ1122158.1 hypothetical protein [Microbacterium trichothecenolyticum]